MGAEEGGPVIPRFSQLNLPEKGWKLYRRKSFTNAQRIEGPFEVETHEGFLRCEDGWLAVDAEGFPYPIKDSVFRETYEEA
jgi:hypothetical protein